MRHSEARKFAPSEDPEAIGDAHLHVRTRDGYDFITPIEPDDVLDGETLVREFVENTRFAEFRNRELDTVTRHGFEAPFDYTVQTGGRQPHAAACWSSGGFYDQKKGTPTNAIT